MGFFSPARRFPSRGCSNPAVICRQAVNATYSSHTQPGHLCSSPPIRQACAMINRGMISPAPKQPCVQTRQGRFGMASPPRPLVKYLSRGRQYRTEAITKESQQPVPECAPPSPSPSVVPGPTCSVDATTEVPEDLFLEMKGLGRAARRRGQHVLSRPSGGPAKLILREQAMSRQQVEHSTPGCTGNSKTCEGEKSIPTSQGPWLAVLER